MSKTTKRQVQPAGKKGPVLSDAEVQFYRTHLEKKGYTWLGYLGTGNWGEVYKVCHNELESIRAAKILLPRHLKDHSVIDQFYGEAKKMAKLRHNHIVNILDLGAPDNKPYYVMEFIETSHLGEFLVGAANLERDDYLQILLQLCEVLSYIHKNEIVHLDIKAENVLVERDLSAAGIKLADFGLAKSTKGSSSSGHVVNPDIAWMPKSLLELRGKKVSRTAFKPVHDLAYLGKMLEDVRFHDRVAPVWSDRQRTILRKLISELQDERLESAAQLRKKLAKLSPSHPPTAGVQELAAAHAIDSTASIRIPPKNIVPMTERVRKLIELPEFQRLRRVKQLGPTSLVYPGATHTRFEHSLGAFALAIGYLNHLLGDPQFDYLFEREHLTSLLAAVLLHDIGHYPFSHQLEELRDNRFPDHRNVTRDIVCGHLTLPCRPASAPTIEEVLNSDFDITSDAVAKLIKRTHRTPDLTREQKILASFLDSALDVDKLDYLMRDSVHCGVEYAMHIDCSRLLRSLTISPEKNELAVTEKGRLAAEYMIMSRSAMFSEVYWHHTNRAATAMIQRAFLDMLRATKIRKQELLDQLLIMSDEDALRFLVDKGPSHINDLIPNIPPWSTRQVYKRLLTFASYYLEDYKRDIYGKLVDLDHSGVKSIERAVVRLIRKKHPTLNIQDHEILLDIPKGERALAPVQIVYPSVGSEISLDSVTHFSKSIFEEFFKHTKKARIFCSPRVKGDILSDRDDILYEIARRVDVAIPQGAPGFPQ